MWWGATLQRLRGEACNIATASFAAIREKIASAKRAVDKKLKPQPAGAKIQPCPKGGKKQRVQERREKISKGKKRIADMEPGKERDALEHATTRFERNNVAVERARLAADAYVLGRNEPPEGWGRVTSEELKELNMSERLFPQLADDFRADDYRDGYYAELYRSNPDVLGEERYVLVFRGTQGNKDWKTNGRQAFGLETEHYSKAMETAKLLKASPKLGSKLDIAGHSLGGGMATAAGIVTDSPTYTINPAGVHPDTLERFGRNYGRAMADKNIQNYVTRGEILDTVQEPSLQRALFAVVTSASPRSGALMAVAGRRAVLEQKTITYGAAGPVYELPVLTNSKDVVDGKTMEGMSPGLRGRLNNNINPIQKVELHDPAYAIAGIEQQKADDILTIDRYIEI